MSAPGTRHDWWRSLAERSDAPEFREFVEAEFPSEAPRLTDPVTRRRFLQVMGASMALAGVSACSRWPEEEIVPHARRPEDVVPGESKLYASSFEVQGVGFPVLVKSFDGRPVKVDGNPEHPSSGGGSDAITQASVLELYDPDRSREVSRDGQPSGWAAFEAWLAEVRGKLSSGRGKGLRVLSGAVCAPTLAALKGSLRTELSEARWLEYEPFSRDTERAGLLAATGKHLRAVPRLADADLVVSFDDDLLGDHPAAVRNTCDFARGRRAENGRMNRLMVVESALTVTGAAADNRHPLTRENVARAAISLAAEILGGMGSARSAKPLPWTAKVAAEMTRKPGRTLITAGPGMPAGVHALVALANRELGNVGKTVEYFEAPERPAYVEALRELVEEMKAGSVDTLVVLGGNPLLNAPADLDFAGALKRVESSVHLSLFSDETSAACTWHLPMAHWLESWGDASAFDGTPGVVQPLIKPLHGGRSPLEIAALLLGEAAAGARELVRRTWKAILPETGFERSWRKVLHDGFHLGSRPAPAKAQADPARKNAFAEEVLKALPSPAWSLVLRRSPGLHDGRFANNGWLAEMPDPITKLTWDNAALVSPGDAEALGVKDGDHVRVSSGGGSVTLPAFVLPGQPRGSVTLDAGFGRRRAGRVADGMGTDVYPLLSTKPGTCEVRKASGHTDLATTMNNHAIDAVGRKGVAERLHRLIRQATLEEYGNDPDFAKHGLHHPPLRSIWKEREPGGRRWGMVIDLSACTGCSACVVACQSENNVPVVGKEEVRKGREMHWLRVDRYFGGDPDDPEVSFQPLPCMQCENAPCEQVCPVTATVHSDEGLNDMVYNRCIGTRYCSNNCPYKVRRFNWFKNHDGLTDVQKMVFNPEVTMRSRGVMEKCNYCVQRISTARIRAKNEGRPIRDEDVVPACAQACPAEAIVFGDLADPGSKVREAADGDRAYAILEELNVKPRTRYLGRLKNPWSVHLR